MFGAFAGCLAPESSNASAISRQHTMTLDPDIAEQLNEYGDDPEGALDLLIDTTLVVRVADAGDYVIEYTDESGASRTKELPGLAPGTPAMVSGADPLAPAILKKGADVAAVRGGVNGVWWHVGDLPVGFNVTPGAKSVYDINARLEESLTLSDLGIGEMDVTVSALSFQIKLPMQGVASWEMTPDAGDGAPLLLEGEVSIPNGAGDLATLDVTATQGGAPGTAGVIAGVDDAVARGSARLWIKDGQPSAAQFLGGSAKATPRVTMWADGFFADLAEGQSCGGASRADACSPEELQAFDESVEADEKEVFDAADFPKVEDDEGREALALLQRLFSIDIVPGDSATLIFRGDSRDFTGGDPSAPDGDFLVEFTIEASDVEDVTVPAGTFRALKITEETRTVINLRGLDDGAGTTILDEFAMDETIARMTMWLDATTYEPVKMTAETPVDVDAVLKRMLDAVEPGVWDQIGGKPIDNSQWKVTASGTSTYALREHREGTHFSALVGLSLGHALAGTFAGGPIGAMVGGFGATGYGRSTAVPIYPEEVPRFGPASLTLVGMGVIDGGFVYSVESASSGLTWDRLSVNLDDASLYPAFGAECEMPTAESFVICRDGSALSWEDEVLAGDSLYFLAESGQLLTVNDAYTGTTIFVNSVG